MTHPTQTVKGARRAAIVALIVSLAITAAVGIFVLLTGQFGETQGRVLLTTLIVAGFSTVALCHLAVVTRPVKAVGLVGLAVSAIALLLGVVLVWMPWDSANHEVLDWVGRGFAVTGIAAVSLAQANLLLLLAGRRHPFVRAALAATLVAVAVVAVMVALPIVSGWSIPGAESSDTYWRWFGVVAIFDALGTVVLPVAGLLIRDRPAGDAAVGAPTVPDASAPTVPDPAAPAVPGSAAATALDARVAALSAATGLDREALLHAALDAFEARGTEARGTEARLDG